MSAFNLEKQKYVHLFRQMLRSTIAQQIFTNILRDSNFHIADYEKVIEDKNRFLTRPLTTRYNTETTVEDTIIQAAKSDTIANKQEVLNFFGFEEPPKPFDMAKLAKFNKIVSDVNSGIKTIDTMEEIRQFLFLQIHNRIPDSMFGQMYNHYAFHIKEKYGDRPYVGKWSVRFCEQVIDENGQLCTVKGTIPIIGLKIIKTLSNPDSPHLDNPIYYGFMEHMIQFILFSIGTNIMEMTPIAKAIVRIINDAIGYEYIIINCKEGLGSYTCGRAVTSIHKESTKIPRLLIYNTVSSENPDMDSHYYTQLTQETDGQMNLQKNKDMSYYSSKYNKETDQEQKYYEKYLKYKSKYLHLKNKL